jgi:AcrR family transcriptional regulator
MGHPKFSQLDFLEAAQKIGAANGPAAVSIASITESLKAPIGSFYHRFASRDVLLGELWLRAVLDFQTGITAALDAGDGLRAALHTPAWARAHRDKARLLLLYDRKDFVQGEWPKELRDRVAEMTERMEAGSARRAKVIFGKSGRQEVRLSQFLVSEVPVAAVRQHLLRSEPPPPLVDHMIALTFRAVLADYRSGNGRAPTQSGTAPTRGE